MFRLFFFSFLLVSAQATYAQSTDNIPYSRIGLGDIFRHNNYQSIGMGGLGASLHHPLYLNFANPASYSSLSFTNFEFGGRSNISVLQSDTVQVRSGDASISYFVAGLPVTKKGGMAFGFVPYSHVGYNIIQNYSDTLVGDYNIRKEGKGNVNQLFIGGAYDVIKGLTIGANIYYTIGNIDYNAFAEFGDTNLIANTEKLSKTNVRGTQIKIGALYEHIFSKIDEQKRALTIGATYTSSSKYTILTDNDWIRFNYNVLGGVDYSNANRPDTIYSDKEIKGNISMPQSFSLGLSYNKLDNYTIGINAEHTQWKKYRKNGSADLFSNETVIAAGLEYIPDIKSIKGYTKKIAYRFGVNYSTGKWQLNDLNNTKISEAGISYGMGFPLKKMATRINTAFELGFRGNNDAQLIRETYFRIHFGISMNDNWFIKPKID